MSIECLPETICSISLTKNPTSVSATVIFNKSYPTNEDEPNNLALNVPDKLNIGGYELKLKNVSKAGYLKVTASYTYQYTNKILGFAHFKTMNRNIYNALDRLGELSRNKIVGSSGDLFLRFTDDPYLIEGGFTPDEILDVFGIRVIYPPIYNYKITELVVRQGMTVISLISALFPFPFIMNVLPDETIEIISQCYSLGGDYTYQEVHDVIVQASGMYSKPVNIIDESDEVFEDNIHYIKNTFGKIHSIPYERYYVKNSVKARLADRPDESEQQKPEGYIIVYNPDGTTQKITLEEIENMPDFIKVVE